MRYFYQPPKEYTVLHGRVYYCKHPAYISCTLYEQGFRGLAVIQQRYDKATKSTTWTSIDDCLVDDIFRQPGFNEYFEKHAGEPRKGIYPTVSVRQIMWALRMKSLKKQPWETVFERKIV